MLSGHKSAQKFNKCDEHDELKEMSINNENNSDLHNNN